MRKCFVLALILTFLFLFVFEVKANDPPVADANGPYRGARGIAVTFDGSDSFDPDEDPLTYDWDFGDGTSGTGESPTHSYSSIGDFTVTLTVNDGEETSSPSTSPVTILPRPPSFPIVPEDEAEAIELNPDLTFTLEWEIVSETEEYYYQFWQEGKSPEEEIRSSDNVSEPILSIDLDPGAKYLWRVKSCADDRCGDYGEIWSFIYLLFPPSVSSFSPPPGSTNVFIPVTFDWEDVIGAKSYEILAVPCPAWMAEEGCFELPVMPDEGSQHTDEICFFTKKTYYGWFVRSCLDEQVSFCGPESTQSNFETARGAPPLLAPILQEPLFNPDKPNEIPKVSKNSQLSWNGTSSCAYLYKVRVVREEDNVLIEFFTYDIQDESISLGDEKIEKLKQFWSDSLNLNKVFSWNVTPCWADPSGFGWLECDPWVTETSETWRFQITVEAPSLLGPDDQSLVKIPVTLSWEKIDGAGSYFYQVASDDAFTNVLKEESTKALSVKIDYPDILLDTQYWWRVKTCVDEQGEVCGEEGIEERTFITYPINLPTNPNPPSPNGTTTLPARLTWDPDPGANYYQYKVDYATMADEETLEGCEEKAGTPVVPPRIVSQPGAVIYENCLGEYNWWVRSCLDKNCTPEVSTGWSPVQTFTALEPPPEEKGIVPCGRKSNNPDTPYNEKEACQLKHTGFMLQNILDFLLWRLGLIILGILAVVSGATSYFALGDPAKIAKIKLIWKSAGTGWAIILLAWLFINLLMAILGFQIEFFGRWWQLPF